MSGLRNFIGARGGLDEERSSTPPPSAQPHLQQRQGKPDRSAFRALKVRSGEKATVNSQTFGKPLASITPALAYISNSNHLDGRNTFPNQQYDQFNITQPPNFEAAPATQIIPRQEQHVPVHGGAFDDTLTSGLEDTKSDLKYNGNPRGMDGQGAGPTDEDRYDRQDEGVHDQYMHQNPRQRISSQGRSSTYIAQHGLQHKHSRSPLIDTEPEEQLNPYAGQSTHGIRGRFQQALSAPKQRQQDVAHRNSNVQHIHASRKRGLSDGREYENFDPAAYNQDRGIHQEGFDGSGDEEYDSDEPPEEERELPAHNDDGNTHHENQNGGPHGVETRSEGAESVVSELTRHGLEPRSEGAETAISVVSRRQARRDEVDKVLRARIEDKSRYGPDRKDEELECMDYADLKKEAWDGKPSREKRDHPTQTQDTEFTLQEYVINIVEDGTAEGQVTFFEELSMEQYEETGDFFIDKFTDLMKKIRDARKKKRDLVTKFEDEIEAREKAVRGKSDVFDRKFEAMRAGGEGVLNSKA